MNRTYLRDLNMAAVWAGLTAFVWYGFGALPLHLEVAGQLGLSPSQSSSWIFVIWFSGAITSIALTLYYRIPIPITWTIPGLIYLGTLAGQFSFPEIVGANLMAGVAILVLGAFGIGERIMAWLPLPIVMGMFAGSILVYVTRMVAASVADVLVAGVTLAAYLVGRFVASPRIPPMGLAVVIGGIAVFAFGETSTQVVSWSLPDLTIPGFKFTLSAFIAISLPMIILAMGLGNVQGLGFLLSQEYRVPITAVTITTGLNSMVNALLGGHPATVARTGAAILAAPDAGPKETRYWANVIAATLTISIALGAGTLSSLLAVLPRTFVVTLAGLAILSSLQSAFETAFGGKLRFGALAALAVAATPFAVFGITSAFWAILAGIAASFMAERHDLLAYWKGQEQTPD
ncbi:MAG: benzoate/H(+) symporter BenE family transporter [Alphaproteobacteria bacterium]|nr:benzoate/H(+) symporter BenE family transporter [Alphaproteobacteria bacterium]